MNINKTLTNLETGFNVAGSIPIVGFFSGIARLSLSITQVVSGLAVAIFGTLAAHANSTKKGQWGSLASKGIEQLKHGALNYLRGTAEILLGITLIGSVMLGLGQLHARAGKKGLNRFEPLIPYQNLFSEPIPEGILKDGVENLKIDLTRMNVQISIGQTNFKINLGTNLETPSENIDISNDDEKKIFIDYFVEQAKIFCIPIEPNEEKRLGLLNAIYAIVNQYIQNRVAWDIIDLLPVTNCVPQNHKNPCTQTITYAYDPKTKTITWERQFILDIFNLTTEAVEIIQQCTAKSTIRQNKQGSWEINEPIRFQFTDYLPQKTPA